ncbi:MAG: hypothetical protein LBQ59_01930 [Candidatus Peribacteria bacterium]|jgi:hypothetical protein|nr:hypothetical protein [Candidatus Peribacteria bacterium]
MNKNRNDDYEIYLSAKDSNYKNEATILLNQSILNLNSLKTAIDNYDYSGNRDEIVQILQQFYDEYDLVYKMSDALYNAGEYSIE